MSALERDLEHRRLECPRELDDRLDSSCRAVWLLDPQLFLLRRDPKARCFLHLSPFPPG